MIGQVGDILIASAFLSLPILWVLAFSTQVKKVVLKTAAFLHLGIVFSAIVCLYLLIFGDRFEYTYVWKHSAIEQLFAFKLSCLWEGQEGSFLLWIFWNALLILFVAYKPKLRRVLLFLIPIQMYLLSLILGIQFTALDFELGSSPFSLLKDTIQSEVYAINPNFVPTDGQGMNALLQNYWMVIHPPIIFLGFAISALPFCLCLAGISSKEKSADWVEDAFPWAIVSIVALGIGMLMGAYWAYETLNFGGFWNWDPVENAIYIPWIILIAAMHLMLIYKKKQKALNQLTILTLISYLLVIYSTFLTRSGILGDSSVHSFTDSGLSTQLLVFLLLIISVSVVFYVRAYPRLKSTTEEESTYTNYEFWMFLGVLALCISAFQVFLPTSFPVFNKIASSVFDYSLTLATPSDQVVYYSNFQIWFGLSFMVLIIIGQFFYRSRVLDKTFVTNILFLPVIITAVVSVLLYFILGVEDKSQLKIFLILVLSVFCLSISFFLFNKSSESLKNKSSSFSHLGLMVFFIGILISQGYRKVLTSNTQFTDQLNRLGNTLLVKNKPVELGGFTVTYNKSFFKSKEGGRINKDWLSPTYKTGVLQAKRGFSLDGKNVEVDDEIQLDSKNSFYNISIESKYDKIIIEPRVQMNSQMGVIASPDIDKHWHGDVYTHVSNFPDPNKKTDWSKAKPLHLKSNDEMMLGSKILKLDSIQETMSGGLLTVQSYLSMITPDTVYSLQPSIIYSEAGTDVVASEILEKGIKLVIYDARDQESGLGFYYLSEPNDWITIKSIYFPMINLVWLGGLMMLFGTCLSLLSYLKVFERFPKLKRGLVAQPIKKKSLVYN